VARYTITNTSTTTVTGWRVEFDLPTGTTVAHQWDATLTRTGAHQRFDNKSYNASIAPGATRTFGFTASGTGSPSGCLVNGEPCASTPPTATTRPPATTTRPPATTTRPPGTTTTRPPFTTTNPPTTTRPPTTTPPVTTPPPGGRLVPVANPTQLRAALTDARAGDVIQLADGTYAGRFALINKSGTADARIVVTGSRNAVLDGGDVATGYGFELRNVSHVRLIGFTVTRSQKAVVTDHATFSEVDGLYLHHLGAEAVALRRMSTDNVVRNSLITETGMVSPQYGEGVYIGTWNGNWPGGVADASDRNQVVANTIGPNVRAEHVDIKEGTRGGVVRGNRFDGRGLSGQNFADSWVDAQGNGYVIEDNVGTFAASGGGVFANGFETHILLAGWGCGNTFRRNSSDLGGVGQYAIRVQLPVSDCGTSPNVVLSNNTVANARNGLTNVPVTAS
jgi:hypothetical protein